MDYNQTANIEEDEIDLLELGRALKDKLLAIVLCGLICAAIAAAYCFIIAKPVYQSTAKLYVLTQSTSITSFADIQISTNLAYDYQEMIKSRPVINEVKSTLDLDYTYSEIVSAVTIENPEDTRILKISVEDNDPELAAEIANTLAYVAKENISKIMKTDAPQLFEKAIVAKSPIKPSKTKTIGLGLIGGLLLACGVVTVKFLTNDRIKTAEDIEKITGLTVLARIPEEAAGGDK